MQINDIIFYLNIFFFYLKTDTFLQGFLNALGKNLRRSKKSGKASKEVFYFYHNVLWRRYLFIGIMRYVNEVSETGETMIGRDVPSNFIARLSVVIDWKQSKKYL